MTYLEVAPNDNKVDTIPPLCGRGFLNPGVDFIQLSMTL
jgi:hypothetical protein